MIEAGRPIQVGNLSLTVLLEIESGSDRRVYKVKDQRGILYVYKHAKRRAVKRELERTALIAKVANENPALAGAYAKVVESGSDPSPRRNRRDNRDSEESSHGSGYLVREWVQGVRGDDWLKSWESFGAPLAIEAVQSLFLLLDISARVGVYIGKLDPEDMIFDGSKWVIVDCGSVRSMPPQEAASRYFWNMFQRWGAKLDRHRSSGNALSNLFALLSPLGQGYLKTPITEDPTVQVVDDTTPSSPNTQDEFPEDTSSGDLTDEEEEEEERKLQEEAENAAKQMPSSSSNDGESGIG